MAAQFIFYTIMIVVFVGYGIVMHFMKRDEQRESFLQFENFLYDKKAYNKEKNEVAKLMVVSMIIYIATIYNQNERSRKIC